MSQEPKVDPTEPMGEGHGNRKKPLLSCEKYDEEERKEIWDEEKKS